MSTAGPYSRAVAKPARPVIAQGAGDGAASRVRVETVGGLVWVIGPDGIRQPCSSPRVAATVAASVRHLGAS